VEGGRVSRGTALRACVGRIICANFVSIQPQRFQVMINVSNR